jgi:hypothetical protein
MGGRLAVAVWSTQPLRHAFAVIVLVGLSVLAGCGGSSGGDDQERRAAADASAACSRYYGGVLKLGLPAARPTAMAPYLLRIASRARPAAREIRRAAATAPAGELRMTLELQARLLRSRAGAFERYARRVAADHDTVDAASRIQRSLLKPSRLRRLQRDRLRAQPVPRGISDQVPHAHVSGVSPGITGC